MDAFSLTNWKRLIFCMVSGCLCFVLTFFFAEPLFESVSLPYFSAIIAEFLKGLPLLYLVLKRKIVMLGDATIYGSALGAGYAMSEIIYFTMLDPSNTIQAYAPVTAVILGFETAVMHIGCSSLLAYGLIMAKQETTNRSYFIRNLGVVAVFLITSAVHIIHNVAPIPPLLLTTILTIYFILSKRHIFKKNESNIHTWIDECLNNDVALLSSIKKGELSKTNAGKYLVSIKDAFSPEVFFDLCCYISEYLELSITAKSNLLLRQAGFPVQRTEKTKARINELFALRKRIGKAGVEAVKPIVNIEDVDYWAVNALL